MLFGFLAVGFMTKAGIQPGTILFGRFKVVHWLGIGKETSVYTCKDRFQFNKKVVLKVLSKKECTDPIAIERLLREYECLNHIRHPSIVECYEMFGDDDYLAFSMEYCDGGNLAEYLLRNRNLEMKIIVKFLAQISEALKAIHDAGIVHRDLKPDNILIDSEGNLRVADFGISVPEPLNPIEERDGISGTLTYVSPEYLQKGQLDRRSDIYALGMIAFEMITGCLPYQAQSTLESMRLKVREDAVRVNTLRADCPEGLSLIVSLAMARLPEARYQTIEDFIQDLFLFNPVAFPKKGSSTKARRDSLSVILSRSGVVTRGLSQLFSLF